VTSPEPAEAVRYPVTLQWFDEQSPEPLGWPVNVDDGKPVIIKAASYIEVPNELLMDYGVIPDTRPKPPPPSWRTRFRWKREQWRERAARRAYRIVAGDWPDDREDDW
jgi:hypothetical protein